MRRIELDELKKIQIEILDEVVNFCERRNLRYFLAYGTLIGAIRHKGYIPWDDDIDIAMPRPDYEMLLSCFNNESKKHKVVSYRTDKSYGMAFAKVHNPLTIVDEHKYKKEPFGVYIDIFPLDAVVSDSQIFFCWLLRKVLNCKKALLGVRRSIFKDFYILVGKILLKPFSVYRIVKKMDDIGRKGNFEEAVFIESFYSSTVKKEKMLKAVFDGFEYAEFEGKKYKIPKGYDQYLKQQYGDYMNLPPEDKRVSHHDSEAYWKE